MAEMRSYSLYHNPLLWAEATLKYGRVRVKVGGPLSILPGIKSAVGMIDGQIPANADEKLYLSTWIPPAPSRAFDRLAQSRMRSQMGIRTPDQVTISITEECPNRCIHCALPDSGRKLRLSPETVFDVIGQILDMGTTLVIFDGGEPARYRELPELVEAVDDRAISTLFTSGAGFTASLATRLKEAGLYAVNVSLDSPVEEEHDAVRGRQGVFQDAMDAVDAALQAGLLVNIYVVLRSENMRHLQEFHRLAKEKGVHELTFFEIAATGRWSGKERVSLTKEDRMHLENFVSSAGRPRIFSVPEAYKLFGCFAGRSWMHITPAGDVYPCACLPESCGSIYQEPIRKIWQRMGRLPYGGSKTCPVRKD
ncbi:MAG: radical SAM protein [Methanotrichaceae archaeon]|nr:radical SAM protein [Methanotrichaceae archaeon]